MCSRCLQKGFSQQWHQVFLFASHIMMKCKQDKNTMSNIYVQRKELSIYEGVEGALTNEGTTDEIISSPVPGSIWNVRLLLPNTSLPNHIMLLLFYNIIHYYTESFVHHIISNMSCMLITDNINKCYAVYFNNLHKTPNNREQLKIANNKYKDWPLWQAS